MKSGRTFWQLGGSMFLCGLMTLALSGCGLFRSEKKKKVAVPAPVTTQTEKPTPEPVMPDPLPTTGPDEIADKIPPLPDPPTMKSTYPTATKVPGKEGMVLSPYNNRLVDVKGMASGKLVADPTYPASEKKYFRVP